MTKGQVYEKAYNWIFRSYRTISLAKHKDGDVYDVLYNVAKDLSEVDYKFVKELQDYAVKCKRDYVNPDVLDFAKELDFMHVESKILDVYSEAIIKYIERELGYSSYDARQLWLEIDKKVMDDIRY